MNYNANFGNRPMSKKPKRVSDVNAMGGTIPVQHFDANSVSAPPYIDNPQQQYQQQQQIPQPQPQPQQQYMQNIAPNNMYPQQQPSFNYEPQPAMVGQQMPNQPIPGLFQQPIVQDMAMQYGQKLADQGKELVHSHFEKYVPITKLKYYFAVDNSYVLNKLKIIFFPFVQKEWAVKYDHDNPVQPRYDVNAPDLYIPTMAYITYVVLAGVVLGMENRFTSEQLGIQASSALAYSIFEMVVYMLTIYIGNISSSLKMLDLFALTGYKYVAIVAVVLSNILLRRTGYYLVLLYSSAVLIVFLFRTMKAKVMIEAPQNTVSYDPYGQQTEHHIGRKRKLYFLFLVIGLQPVLSFWLTMHLIMSDTVKTSA